MAPYSVYLKRVSQLQRIKIKLEVNPYNLKNSWIPALPNPLL
jgi:hypothetical protein